MTAPPSHSSPLQGGASAETSVPVGVCREYPDEGKCRLLHPDASCTLQSTCLGEAGTELQGSSGLQMPAMEWSRCLGMASQRKPNLLHNLRHKGLEDTSNGSIIPTGRTDELDSSYSAFRRAYALTQLQLLSEVSHSTVVSGWCLLPHC